MTTERNCTGKRDDLTGITEIWQPVMYCSMHQYMHNIHKFGITEQVMHVTL